MIKPTVKDVEEAIALLEDTKELPKVSKVEAEVKSVAQEASELLGYDSLLAKTGSGILGRVLVDLGIEAIDRFAVYVYQCKFGFPLINPHKSKSVASMTETGFLLDAKNKSVRAARNEDREDESTSESASDDGVEEGRTNNVDVYQSGHTMLPGKSKFSMEDAWGRTPIRYYTEEIPEFVLNKAIQIKKALPTVGVYVEHLVDQPDPFLVVASGGEEFYVEVWMEPGFEGRVTKETKNVSSNRSQKKHRR